MTSLVELPIDVLYELVVASGYDVSMMLAHSELASIGYALPESKRVELYMQKTSDIKYEYIIHCHLDDDDYRMPLFEMQWCYNDGVEIHNVSRAIMMEIDEDNNDEGYEVDIDEDDDVEQIINDLTNDGLYRTIRVY